MTIHHQFFSYFSDVCRCSVGINRTPGPSAAPSTYSTINPTVQPTLTATPAATDNPTIGSTSNPSIASTLEHTNEPTVQSDVNEQTTAERAVEPSRDPLSDSEESASFRSFVETHQLLIIVVAVSALALLLCCLIFVNRSVAGQKPTTKNSIELTTTGASQKTVIRNGLIVGIAISEYDSECWDNLNVSKDLDNLSEFGDFLGYDFMSNDRKLYWTKEEILSYLRDDVGNAFFTPKGRARYDGLVVCVTGHGVRDHVVTSQLEHVEKMAIHGCICDKYPRFVDIPRIFIFDVCADQGQKLQIDDSMGLAAKGDRKSHVAAVNSDELNSEILESQYETKEQGDIGNVGDLDNAANGNCLGALSGALCRNTALIHAVNSNYQAKMSGDVGSHLLTSFIYRVEANQARHERMGLEELMEEIQNRFLPAGRQQPVAVYHDTENLILERKLSMRKPL